LIIAEYIVYEAFLRTWDKINYGTWFVPLELVVLPDSDDDRSPPPSTVGGAGQHGLHMVIPVIYVLTDRKEGDGVKTPPKKKSMMFDFSDIFSCSTLLGHSIWYCYIQSSCLSAENATVWNCYNLFGYRLYNYIYYSYMKTSTNSMSKFYIAFKNKKEEKTKDKPKKEQPSKLSRIIHNIGLFYAAFTMVFVGALLVPYVFTNVISMLFIYINLAIIYMFGFTVIISLIQYYKCIINTRDHTPESTSSKLLPKLDNTQIIILLYGIRLFPYIIIIFYNYSQYIYFGDDYFQAMADEYNSRNTSGYFSRVANDSKQIAHVILSTL
jgi:hypothetical protein